MGRGWRRGPLGLGDRRSEEARWHVVAFEISRVRQDEVSIGHHLRRIGVGIDDAGNNVLARLVGVGEQCHHRDVFMLTELKG